MDTKVLVTYASKYGATKEMAERIAEVLRREGLDTETKPAKEVGTLDPYRAVVLGSALYIGRWRKEARKFLKRYEEGLAARDVWMFLSGPTGDEEDTREAWHPSKKLEARLERIDPHDIKVFHGAIDVDKLSGLDKWVIDRVKAPVGDFRDWEAVTAWASAVARRLKGTLQEA